MIQPVIGVIADGACLILEGITAEASIETASIETASQCSRRKRDRLSWPLCLEYWLVPAAAAYSELASESDQIGQWDIVECVPRCPDFTPW
jgi:hypothetical protein